ncbi:hypothetical protein LCGC14_2324330 [marine sediment metagenome]|uniref:Uncharacterized protein n=1 Tax=marine sediment metagenome TaxID=412755 RepID=A0A0F9CHG2_9ZZZZ
MANIWYAIPKSVTVDRGDGDEHAIRIEVGLGNGSIRSSLGMDGGLTLKEAEDLAWRLKQGIGLLKNGKIPYQHA